MVKERIKSFEDLEVYQKLCELPLNVHKLSLTFPKFELHELGSQLRRSSNSIPANLAEGWNNKHLNIYLEGINRALGELRETKHHLTIAYKKNYFPEKIYKGYIEGYNECGRMLKGLERSLEKLRPSK